MLVQTALRVKWCKARAHAHRWSEEVELLQEESLSASLHRALSMPTCTRQPPLAETHKPAAPGPPTCRAGARACPWMVAVSRVQRVEACSAFVSGVWGLHGVRTALCGTGQASSPLVGCSPSALAFTTALTLASALSLMSALARLRPSSPLPSPACVRLRPRVRPRLLVSALPCGVVRFFRFAYEDVRALRRMAAVCCTSAGKSVSHSLDISRPVLTSHWAWPGPRRLVQWAECGHGLPSSHMRSRSALHFGCCMGARESMRGRCARAA